MSEEEHHHHDQIDLFPDFKRTIPFGTGTSIVYNYLDYRFKNTTDITYQLIIYTTDEYLCGELRADKRPDYKYHISMRKQTNLDNYVEFEAYGDVLMNSRVDFGEL